MKNFLDRYLILAWTADKFTIIINLQLNKYLIMQVHPEEQQPVVQRRASLMDIPMKKFAAEQFDQKAVVLCQFCGGESCKQQDYRTNKIQPNAIEGLHSNWISPQILAMQRPSQRLIGQFGLYKKFHENKINSILNLQEPGEHPYCGDGIIPMVGFSYDPEGFFANNISFFNESWEDMTATTFEHMMRIMNIFYMSIVKNKGKISVHCHAGRGRTLLVICSWLIYYDRMSAKATIDLAVQKREGVLTRSSQRQFLYDFQQQLKTRWISFGKVPGKSFSQFIQIQKVSLLKHEQTACKFQPYVHSMILEELRSRIIKDTSISKQIIYCLMSCDNEHLKEKWNQKDEQNLQRIKEKINNHTFFARERDLFEKTQIKVLTELLFDFYDQLPFVLITIHALEALVQHANKIDKKIQALFEPQFVHQTGVESISVMLDFVHLLKFLVKQNLNIVKEDSQDSKICDCLFLRISLMLSSKRKYYHKIFPHKKRYRQCRLLKYEAEKREKYTSTDDVKLANYMRSITREMGEDLQEIEEIILKIRKIDSNLHYFTQQHNSDEGFIKKNDAKQIYNNSRA